MSSCFILCLIPLGRHADPTDTRLLRSWAESSVLDCAPNSFNSSTYRCSGFLKKYSLISSVTSQTAGPECNPFAMVRTVRWFPLSPAKLRTRFCTSRQGHSAHVPLVSQQPGPKKSTNPTTQPQALPGPGTYT